MPQHTLADTRNRRAKVSSPSRKSICGKFGYESRTTDRGENADQMRDIQSVSILSRYGIYIRADADFETTAGDENRCLRTSEPVLTSANDNQNEATQMGRKQVTSV